MTGDEGVLPAAPSGLERAIADAVGTSGPPVTARHAVNEPMISDWCDAMGDANPCYRDAAFASSCLHGGIVAPPAMLDVWDRPGLALGTAGRSPRGELLLRLFEAGYDSIVAVNTELELARYLRPGELVTSVETLAEVSPEKRTARGPGHFLTTRHRYTNERAEHVGDLMFRILVFRPEADVPAEAAGLPEADPALRPEPAVNDDNRFFWEGAARRELRIQRCEGCGRLLMPPGPRCPSCGSFALGFVVASGHGHLYSFAGPEHPRVAGFTYPLTVGLVELEEGTRLVAELVGLDRERDVRVGMPLELTWLEGPRGPLPGFRAPAPVRRSVTLRPGELRVGGPLPVCSLPVTATLVVAGALATRDFTAVHHDREAARREGSRDIFMNINTSVGLLQRVVSDWAGPEAVFRSIRVRLGGPAYPGDLLSFSGQVSSLDPRAGTAVVAVRAGTSLGDHAVATVELALPAGPEAP